MTMSGNKKLESDFQEKAIKLIRDKGGYVVKIHVSALQSQGEPDLMCCYLGRFICFELKIPGNKASELQKFKIKQITNAGGIAKAVYSLKEIEETLYEIQRLQSGGQSS